MTDRIALTILPTLPPTTAILSLQQSLSSPQTISANGFATSKRYGLGLLRLTRMTDKFHPRRELRFRHRDIVVKGNGQRDRGTAQACPGGRRVYNGNGFIARVRDSHSLQRRSCLFSPSRNGTVLLRRQLPLAGLRAEFRMYGHCDGCDREGVDSGSLAEDVSSK